MNKNIYCKASISSEEGEKEVISLWDILSFIKQGWRWLIGGLLLALGYPIVKFLEFRWNLSQGINGESGIFFTTYYYLTLTHMVHAIWGILGILWCLARHWAGVYSAEDYSGLEALASYWHATDIIWLVIFPFFYVLV